MTATLDQQLTDLARIHGLKALSLHVYQHADGSPFFGVNVHREHTHAASPLDCDGLVECFKAAMTRLNEVTVTELAPLEAPVWIEGAHAAGRIEPDPFYERTEQ